MQDNNMIEALYRMRNECLEERDFCKGRNEPYNFDLIIWESKLEILDKVIELYVQHHPVPDSIGEEV